MGMANNNGRAGPTAAAEPARPTRGYSMTRTTASRMVNAPTRSTDASTSPRPRAITAGLILLPLLLAGCAEPFIVMPGGKLSGEVADPPADWTPLNEVEIVQLETRPEDPYSVNVWMIAKGPHIYIATGEDDTNWTRHIDENPDVRLRINGTIYELTARRVLNRDEKIEIGRAYVEKYGVDDDDNWVESGQLFRLDRR